MTDSNDLTKYALCKAIGKPKKIIDDWIALGCPHVKRDGRYSFKLSAVLAWREEYMIKKEEGEGWSPLRMQLEEQRIRIMEERTKALKWENQKRAEELVDPREAEKAWKIVSDAVRKKALAILSGLAEQIAAQDNPNVVQALMTEANYQLLTELSSPGFVEGVLADQLPE